MSTMQMMTARQWAQLMGLALVTAVAILVMVAVVLPTAALVMAAALLAMGAAVVAQRVGAVARATRAAVSGQPAPDSAAQPTVRLELPGGEVLSARAVPLAGESEHALLLTRDGYVVVSAEGKVLHRL